MIFYLSKGVQKGRVFVDTVISVYIGGVPSTRVAERHAGMCRQRAQEGVQAPRTRVAAVGSSRGVRTNDARGRGTGPSHLSNRLQALERPVARY